MSITAGYLTLLLQVRDLDRSLRFYSRLGFETVDIEKVNGVTVWARMHCAGGAIMFVPAEEDELSHVGSLGYLYTPDLPQLCAQLTAAGVEVGPISYPHYMRSGEICLRDPDGYVLLVGHWGSAEDEAWQRQRDAKRTAGLIP
jgi:catechol 2,3-dioxygenase-like lactoylglutathione lyase family enzyme